MTAILLSGCTHYDWHKVAEPQTVAVTWERSAPGACGGYPSIVVQGCAYVYGDRCSIVMPENSSDAVVAHEFKHCFGWSH